MIKSRMTWAGYVAHIGDLGSVFEDLVGKPEGKSLFGKA
jgi:hypothetical protein